jgi:hypothetical protein
VLLRKLREVYLKYLQAKTAALEKRLSRARQRRDALYLRLFREENR